MECFSKYFCVRESDGQFPWIFRNSLFLRNSQLPSPDREGEAVEVLHGAGSSATAATGAAAARRGGIARRKALPTGMWRYTAAAQGGGLHKLGKYSKPIAFCKLQDCWLASSYVRFIAGTTLSMPLEVLRYAYAQRHTGLAGFRDPSTKLCNCHKARGNTAGPFRTSRTFRNI